LIYHRRIFSELILGINISIKDRQWAAKAILSNPELAHVILKIAVGNPFTYTMKCIIGGFAELLVAIVCCGVAIHRVARWHLKSSE
jgi:putative effector of murein hydrolase